MTRLSKMPLILGSALGLMATAAVAQDAVTIADIRCVIVGMQLSGMANSPQQPRGILLTLYYIGRLDGRSPKLDIEHLIIEETRRMADADYASEEKRCGAGLTEKGQQITEIGKHLVESGKKAP
jgi:hypothetical protein